MLALVHDLGRPERFFNMLRVFKPTSPMSVGTWILTAYGPGRVVAGAAEVARLLPLGFGRLGRLLDRARPPAGLAAAALAPAVASYTAVLLTDTSTPAWHDAHRELPFVFVASARPPPGGLGMICAPLAEAGPARRLAVIGAAVELVVEHRMEQSMGLSAETLHAGTAGRLMTRPASSPPPAGSAPLLLAAAAGRAPSRRAPPLWPAPPAPGSASSRPGRSRPATRSTPSSRSANGSTDERPDLTSR